ncbi:MAG: magnesium/cobalt efflux protein, partial [Ensifer adhaerens]
ALPGFEFQILDADPRRVKRVRIMRKRPPARRRVVRSESDLAQEQAPPNRGNGTEPQQASASEQ